MRSFIFALLGATTLLLGCASSGQDQGLGAIDQNIRGGLFASYEGGGGTSPGGKTTVTREISEDGQPVRKEVVEVVASSPFVILFEGDINADTDASTTGASNDTASATNSTDTDADGTATLTK